MNFYLHFLCHYLEATDWPALLYSYSYISTCCFSMFLSYSCPFCTSMWTEVLLKKTTCGCSLGYFWDVLQHIWWNGKHPCQSWNMMHPHPVFPGLVFPVLYNNLPHPHYYHLCLLCYICSQSHHYIDPPAFLHLFSRLPCSFQILPVFPVFFVFLFLLWSMTCWTLTEYQHID